MVGWCMFGPSRWGLRQTLSPEHTAQTKRPPTPAPSLPVSPCTAVTFQKARCHIESYPSHHICLSQHNQHPLSTPPHLIKHNKRLVNHAPVEQLHALIEARLCCCQLLVRQGVSEDGLLVLGKGSSIVSLKGGVTKCERVKRVSWRVCVTRAAQPACASTTEPAACTHTTTNNNTTKTTPCWHSNICASIQSLTSVPSPHLSLRLLLRCFQLLPRANVAPATVS